MGDQVRYDGGHKASLVVTEILAKYFEFRKFCPELEIGMGVPRKPIKLTRRDSGEIRCVALDDPSRDYTDALAECANTQRHWHEKLCGYILKKKSPSCGMQQVEVLESDGSLREGVGIYADQMMKNFPHLPCEEEGRLEDPVLRENFVQRVFLMRDWQQLLGQSFTETGLKTFHEQHESVASDSRFGELVQATTAENLQENCSKYLLLLMQTVG